MPPSFLRDYLTQVLAGLTVLLVAALDGAVWRYFKSETQVLAGLIIFLIIALVVVSVIWGYRKFEKCRNLVKSLWGRLSTAIKWCIRQWRYILPIILLISIEVVRYRVYPDWPTIILAGATLVVVVLAMWIVGSQGRTVRYRSQYDPIGILKAWSSSDGWRPQIDELGLNLVPHEYRGGMLVCSDLSDFVDGTIECEVFLEQDALFDFTFRADPNYTQFYIARLDARVDYYDCILFTSGGTWKECNDTAQLKSNGHSPAKTWLKMRLVVQEATITLYRNHKQVDQIRNAHIMSGRIGIFAEVANVHIRKIVVSQR